jgi:hypothetical protein
MKTRVSWGIHAVFGCVYLALLGTHLAGWEETRNLVLMFGLGLGGLGLVTCGVLWSLPSLLQPTGRDTWKALMLLGLGTCCLVVATCGARSIAGNRSGGKSAPGRERQNRQVRERQRQDDLRTMIEWTPTAELEEARQRSANLKDSLAGEIRSLIDSVRSGLDGSRIDALQRKKNELETELARFNPYASAAAVERAKTLQCELTRAQAEQEAAIAAIQRQAEDLVLAAVERGELGAFRQIQDQIAHRPRAFSEAQHLAFEKASPDRSGGARIARHFTRHGQGIEEGRTQTRNP